MTMVTATFTYSHTVGFLAYRGRGFIHPVDLTLGDGGVMYVLNRGGAESVGRLELKRGLRLHGRRGVYRRVGHRRHRRRPVLVALRYRA